MSIINLKPTSEEMGQWLTKSTSARSAVGIGASENKNSEINITSIYNQMLVIADRQMAHHEHSATTLMLVSAIIAVVIILVAVKFGKRYFQKKVRQAAGEINDV